MKWNKKFNIISIKNPESIINKHIIDSINIIEHIKIPGKVLDIGTGAGFPSIPLAIYKNTVYFYLLEPKIKKISFIRYIISSLKIKNVNIYHLRLENFYLKEKFTCIISRAFVDLHKLLNFFKTSNLKKCTIILMNSYINIQIVKRFFFKKISNIKIVNVTNTKNIVGHRNLIILKIGIKEKKKI